MTKRANNCGFFACDWIMKLTGIDPAAEYRPKVNSALSARHVIDAAGGIEQIASAAAKVHGWPECPVAYARRGDVVTIKIAGDIALGVCMGARSVYAGPHGVVSIATTECHKAWRIA
jgi:hypothetical protein